MLYACHCTLCQKQSSSAFGLSLIVDPAQFTVVAGQELLKTYATSTDSGAIKKCVFCGNCGTRLYHAQEEASSSYAVKGGSLDNIHELTPIAHIWMKSALPWVEIDRSKFVCVDKNAGVEHELERLWKEQH